MSRERKMAEGRITQEQREAAHGKAAEIVAKFSPKVRNDLARFNLNLSGLNPERKKPAGDPSKRLEQVRVGLRNDLERATTDNSLTDQERAEKAAQITSRIDTLSIVSLPEGRDPEPPEEVLKSLSSPKLIAVPTENPDQIEAQRWEDLPDKQAKEKGQRLSVLVANWDKKDGENAKPVNVFFGNYGNEHLEGESNYRLVELAHQMPEYALFAVDYPQYGKSDKLTKEQKKDFMKVIDAQLRIMKKLGINSVNLMGQSQGAATVLAMAVKAKEYGIHVENLVMAELPIKTKWGSLGLIARTFNEFSDLDMVHALPVDPRMIKAAGMLKSPAKKIWMMLSGLSKQFLKRDPYFRQIRAMAHAPNEERSLQFLEEQGDSLSQMIFLNGSESKVSPAEAIDSLVGVLKAYEDGKYSHKVGVVRYPGMRHLAPVNARQFASNMRTFFENPPKQPVAPQTTSG